MLSDPVAQGPGKGPKNSWRQRSPHYIWQGDSGFEGQAAESREGPGRGPKVSPQAWAQRGWPGAQPRVGSSALGSRTGVPLGLKQRGESWAIRLLVFPAPPPVTGSPLPRAQEAGAEVQASRAGQSWRGRGWGAEGTEGLSLPPLPSGPRNHLASGRGKGFSYQRKLKVTLFLIDLAMFVNYSVTDVAKDN